MSCSLKNNLLTVKEVSFFLKLSVITIYKYIREQKLEAIEFGGHYRIEKSQLIAFVKRHKTINNKSHNTSSRQTRSYVSDAKNE